jgi:hypothetical protein
MTYGPIGDKTISVAEGYRIVAQARGRMASTPPSYNLGRASETSSCYNQTGDRVTRCMARDLKENEQNKEAELVRLRTPLPTICIDWSTGQICVPEPIEHGGQVIPFTAPRSGLRGNANS